jgi:predicted MFS family arabinose efflux permease
MFAIIAGVSVANIYYVQPLLNLVRDELALTDFQASIIALAAQVGYAAGLLLITPLGDLVQRRRVIIVNLVVALVALVAIAASANVVVIIVATLVMGACSVTPQVLIPVAMQCSRPCNKEHNVGLVVSGLLVGIIGSRVLAGTFGSVLGWRMVFVIAAGLMAASAVAIIGLLPSIERNFTGTYAGLMASLGALLRRYPSILVYGGRHAICFASLLAMWTTLTFRMGLAPFYAPASIIGLLGLCGIVGAVTASFVGTFVQRVGVRRFNLIGCALQLAAWLCFFAGQNSYVGIIAGIVLLDVGMQCIQLSNQTSVMALDPRSSSRINTIYMTTVFVGGACGTLIASAAWDAFGWTGVVTTGAALVCVALAITAIYKEHA